MRVMGVEAEVQQLAAAERAAAGALGARAHGADPAAKVLLTRLVGHSRWRAEQWDTLAPTSGPTSADPGPGDWVQLATAIAEAADPVAAWGTLAESLARAAGRLRAADPVGLAAVGRVAARVAADLAADRELVAAGPRAAP